MLSSANSYGDGDYDSLTKLHDSVNELLHSPETKVRIIEKGLEIWAHEVSEASLKMADSCTAAKDLLLLAKNHLHGLNSVFRHIAAAEQTGKRNITFAPYRLPRKQLKKAILNRVNSLEEMETAFPSAPAPAPEDQHLVTVVDMLDGVRATTLAIVRSLMSLIAMPNLDGIVDPGRKDRVFRIRLTRVDSLGLWENCGVSDVRRARKRLEDVETAFDTMECELEGMFRRLIRTRASLLNILTK